VVLFGHSGGGPATSFFEAVAENGSSYCRGANLITAMGAHYFIRGSEIHFDAAASADKNFIVIEGATHGLTPCTACETTPGQYSNSQRNCFDYVARWINARF